MGRFCSIWSDIFRFGSIFMRFGVIWKIVFLGSCILEMNFVLWGLRVIRHGFRAFVAL